MFTQDEKAGFRAPGMLGWKKTYWPEARLGERETREAVVTRLKVERRSRVIQALANED